MYLETEQKQRRYSAPMLEELAIRAERGFAGSIEADPIDPWEEGDIY